jgi:hypothetical protein
MPLFSTDGRIFSPAGALVERARFSFECFPSLANGATRTYDGGGEAVDKSSVSGKLA